MSAVDVETTSSDKVVSVIWSGSVSGSGSKEIERSSFLVLLHFGYST